MEDVKIPKIIPMTGEQMDTLEEKGLDPATSEKPLTGKENKLMMKWILENVYPEYFVNKYKKAPLHVSMKLAKDTYQASFTGPEEIKN